MALQKTEQFANLHLHSTYSDGVYSPAELCARAGVDRFEDAFVALATEGKEAAV